jgi:hypothetical protein
MRHRLAIAAAALLAGCGLASPLDDVPGPRYALVSIEGRALPAPWAPNRAVDDRVTAGELVLADGRGAWALTVVSATTGRARRDEAAFTYRTVGERILVEFPCNDTGSCIGPPHLQGVVTADRVVFDSSRVTRAPLVFARADR